MSVIAGMYNFDGRPVDPGRLRRMTDAAADRAPDGGSTWVDGAVGLGHRMLHTTAESLNEQQPWADDKENLCLTFAGRVDNREELKDLLQNAGRVLRNNTDAELVLQSYARWQEDCPRWILGDFAFVVWDPRQRKLFCARDLVGVKPFYYHASDSSFVWASELRQLLALPEIPRQPNDGMVGEYLLSAVRNREETLFEGIMRLPPANCLSVQPGRIRTWTYWEPGAVASVRYRRDEEYAEHLHALLCDAVGCRLRSHRPVGVQLSGGVDSSLVVAVAQALHTRGRAACPGVEAFSLVFPGWDCDESPFIDDVVAKTGVASHRLVPRPQTLSWYESQVRRYFDVPDYPNGTMSDSLEELARERNIRVMLTGLGGDEWFQGSEYHCADLLRTGRLPSLVRHLRSISDRPVFPIRRSPLVTDGILPLVPESAKAAYRSLRSGGGLPGWINADFAERNSLTDRVRAQRDWKRFRSYASAGLYFAATQGFQTHAIEMEDRSAAGFHLDLRYPFHDRRIIEFGLGLPPEQWRRDGLRKVVLRNAMRDALPDTVKDRRSGAEFSSVFARALKAVGRQPFESLGIASAGWVDGEQIVCMHDGMLENFRNGDARFREHLWSLWHILGLELWFSGIVDR